jgi:hypothetical protein
LEGINFSAQQTSKIVFFLREFKRPTGAERSQPDEVSCQLARVPLPAKEAAEKVPNSTPWQP